MVLAIKNPPANARDARDAGSIPGSGRTPGGEHGNPLQYSCLENPVDRGALWSAAHRVAQSRSDLAYNTHTVMGLLFQKRKGSVMNMACIEL